MGIKEVILTAKKDFTVEVLSAFVVLYIEDASKTCWDPFKGRL